MGDFVGAFGSGSSCTASEVNFIDDRDWCDEGRKTQAKGGGGDKGKELQVFREKGKGEEEIGGGERTGGAGTKATQTYSKHAVTRFASSVTSSSVGARTM